MYIKVLRHADYERQYRPRYENDCYTICEKLILMENTVLLVTVLSNKKYIKNDEHGIFITIDGNVVNVINHKYSYIVAVSDKTKQLIVDLFNKVLEKQRLKMEEEITSNIKHSLKKIAQTLN
jgi:hypothetical protein